MAFFDNFQLIRLVSMVTDDRRRPSPLNSTLGSRAAGGRVVVLYGRVAGRSIPPLFHEINKNNRRSVFPSSFLLRERRKIPVGARIHQGPGPSDRVSIDRAPIQ